MKWVPIKGYEGIYKISEFGKVKSLSRLKENGKFTHITKEKYLKPGITHEGYKSVVLSNNKIKKQISIHQLVAKHFLDNVSNKPQLNHIDGNKLNNHYSNLEYVTVSENVVHAYENFLIPKRQQILLDINSGVYYYSMRDAARTYNVSSTYMIKMINGQKKNRTTLIKV